MFAISCLTCFLVLFLVKTRVVDDGRVAYCLSVSSRSGMTLEGTESEEFNVTDVGTVGIKGRDQTFANNRYICKYR